MTLHDLSRPQPVKRLPKAIVLMAALTAGIVLLALSADTLLLGGATGSSAGPFAVAGSHPTSGDLAVGAAGCLFLLVVWLAIRSRND
ncbi:MAG: hypothetical protein AAF563_23885 [Pseudomonadota bacterium]